LIGSHQLQAKTKYSLEFKGQVASVGEPEVSKVRLGVRFPLATTHPV